MESSSNAGKTAAKSLHLKTSLMILVMIFAGPLGNVLLGKGMKHAGVLRIWPPDALLATGIHIFSTPAIWMGIGSLILFLVSYMLVLSWADYSYVQPAASLAYGVVALLSWLILGEHVSPLRWLGIAIICLGVFVVGRTNPRTTHPAEVMPDTTGPEPAGQNMAGAD
jgi:multidrug transporter EmrE-like cation transporter